ncbi:MAG: Flp family type IVb pilin [Jatrophihabitans sp.]|uniref:Flp family type IVb pilin n=1 Tax=Jatrophihabitans sp. TaxID=1932789 RepID=UPI003F7D8804
MNFFTQLAVMLHVGLAKMTEAERKDRGVTAAEYGLILALIAIVIIGAVTILGGKLSDLFTAAGNAI